MIWNKQKCQNRLQSSACSADQDSKAKKENKLQDFSIEKLFTGSNLYINTFIEEIKLLNW